MHKYRITVISNPLEVDQTTLLDIVMLDDEAATKYAKDIYDKWEEDESRTCVIDEDNICSLNENDVTLHEMTYSILLGGVDTSHIETIENPDDLLDFEDLFNGVGIKDDNEAAMDFITGKANPDVGELDIAELTEDEIDDNVVLLEECGVIDFTNKGYYYNIVTSGDEYSIKIYSSDAKDSNDDYLDENYLDGGNCDGTARDAIEFMLNNGEDNEEV